MLAKISYYIFSTLAVPVVSVAALWDKKWRISLAERLGLGSYTRVKPTDFHRRVWFHAASVGEVGGVSPVVSDLISRDVVDEVFMTTTSLTGKDEVLRRSLSDTPCLLPLDQPNILSRVINKVRPQATILTETEIWPGFLFALKDRKIPTVLINAQISDKTFPRYKMLRYFLRPCLDVFAKILVQTPQDAQRFVAIGAPEDRVEVAGCTKYDQSLDILTDQQRKDLARDVGISRDKPCFVAGSVRSGEVEQVIKAYLKVRELHPDLQMIIAPRHPERFEQVAGLLSAAGIDFNRRSSDKELTPKPVLLVDVLGELRYMYSLATFSFVGGTLVPIGGHNPLEPAAYKCPVILGPNTSKIHDAVEQLKQKGALVTVFSADELATIIDKFLKDKELCKTLGERCFAVLNLHSGATKRVSALIEYYLAA